MIKIFKTAFRGILDHLSAFRNGLKTFNKKLDKFFDVSWTVSSIFGKLGQIVAGIFTMISGIASLIFAILNFDSLVDIIKGVTDNGSSWLEKLEHVVGGYPSFQSLVNSMDGQLSSLSTFFQPALTFTRILQVTGIGDAVNSIVICAVQGLAFVISMRMLFWALGRVKINMVKPIK